MEGGWVVGSVFTGWEVLLGSLCWDVLFNNSQRKILLEERSVSRSGLPDLGVHELLQFLSRNSPFA